MNRQDQNLFAYILSVSDQRAASLHAELSGALFAESEQRARAHRANPQSEARFAEAIGLKANTYVKARRRADKGAPHRWSRKSLALISVCEFLPCEIVDRAYVLLWWELCHGAKPIAGQCAQVRAALTCRELFEVLCAPVADVSVTLQDQPQREATMGGADAS